MKKLLVLDDDADFVSKITACLKKWGYEIEIANSIAQVRYMVEAGRKFDLVLMDLWIDNALASRIGQAIKLASPETRVIWMTEGRDRLEQEARSHGADDIVEKGWRDFEDKLSMAIERLLK